MCLGGCCVNVWPVLSVFTHLYGDTMCLCILKHRLNISVFLTLCLCFPERYEENI